MDEAEDATKPNEADTTTPSVEAQFDSYNQKVEPLLPGLVDLSLAEVGSSPPENSNLEHLKVASVPAHLRGRNVGDVRPPPGF
jgi:hypothetical protein